MSELRTAFELREHNSPWTSISDGDAYLDALLDESPNLTEEIVGESVNGNPMRLIKLGTGRRYVYIVCQQHGSELAGREAAFTLLREWANSTDPGMLDYLTRVTLLVLPTAHPDDIVNRNNANYVNLNRDHVELTQPETQAIHAVMRDYNPDLVLDVHEGNNITNHYATGPTLNGNVDPKLAGLSLELENEVISAITGAGYTWERYQGDSAMIGPEALANNSGIMNRLSILLETERKYGTETDAEERHALQIIALNAIVRWHSENVIHVHHVVHNARRRIAQRSDPIQLMIGTLPFNGATIEPLPTGYVLSDEQYQDIALHRDSFGISANRSDGQWFVPMGQSTQTLIAYLVDPQSRLSVVDATRDYRAPKPPPGTLQPLVDLSNIAGLKFNLQGKIYDAEFVMKTQLDE